MSENLSKLNTLLGARESLSSDVIRPLYTGPIRYADGEGRVVDLLGVVPRALPRRYLSAEGLPKPMRISKEQCLSLIRAFRNHNSVEGACLLCGVRPLDFQDMHRTWSVGRTNMEEIPKEYRLANSFINALFEAFAIASDLAERDFVNVVSNAALLGSVEKTVKKTEFFDASGNVMYGKVETTTKHKPADPNVAMWWLERKNPAQWGAKKVVEHSGSVSHDHTVHGENNEPIDPLTAVMDAIDRIGRDPLPLPERVDDDVLEADFEEVTSDQDEAGGSA